MGWLAAVLLVLEARQQAGELVAHDSDIPFCDPKWLSIVNCPPEEHGVNWEVFLEDACDKCVANKPCQMSHQDLAMQMAQAAVGGLGEVQHSFSCIPGLLAAMIVVAQYFLVKSPDPELLSFLAVASSLAPFPFYTSQYSRYANMVPVGLLLCNTDQANSPAIENRYVPRVHAEDSGLCGMVYTDDQLVRRCRALRYNVNVADRSSAVLESISCPAAEHVPVEEELGRKLSKYTRRANDMQCQDSRGMWNEAMSDVHKCVLITVAHWLGFRPGQLVLDWGSGCGHKLSWAKMLFDVDGLGVEIQRPAVSWAQSHSAGRFCFADGRNLSWIPDNTFDHVISYASIYHLQKDEQCSVGIQLVKKLKIGGRAFLGWNHGPVMNNWEWYGCFRDSDDIVKNADNLGDRGVKVEFDVVEDGYLFPPNPRVMDDKRSFLYQYPAYSIFLTRLE